MKNKNSASLLKFAFSAPFRKYSLTVITAEILAVIFAAASPLVQKNMIDSASNALEKRVFCAVVLLAVLLGGQFALRNLARFMRGLLGVAVRTNLKSEIFRHLLALPEDFLRSRGAGYFFNRIQNDIGEICVFVSGNALLGKAEAFKLIVALSICGFLNWRCMLLMLPFLLLQLLLCYIFRQRQYNLSKKLQECVAIERHLMHEYISTHRTLKSHSAETSAGERIDQGLTRWGGLMRSRLTNENIFSACLQLPVWLCGGIILLAGLYLVVHKQSTLGEVWALLLLMNMVFLPSRNLGTILVQQQSALAAWDRLQELWMLKKEAVVNDDAAVDLRGDLILQDVDFAYQEQRSVFKNLNLHVRWGQGVFLSGANGSGKSTLFALLLRLYKRQAGVISINGITIDEYPLNRYRERIGYIGQNPDFISGTLRDNILLGNKNISDDEIMQCFRALECAELVERQAEGLDYIVAERGDNFSGGERLRLALVRELLRDTDWILFDEAAANLDMAGRQNFYRLLQNLPGDKGVIAIVHDLPDNSSWPVLQLEKLQHNA